MNKEKSFSESRLPFSVTYNAMTEEMRALFRRKAAKAWNCTEDTARRRIKETKLRPYEIRFIDSFCKDFNITPKL